MAIAKLPALPSLLDLIYPELCPACCCEQPVRNHFLCLKCLSDLPLTQHHRQAEDNELAALFWGRIPLAAAAAVYYFSSSGGIRSVLHRIKYDGRSDLAEKMGQLMGYYLGQSRSFKKVDLILPIPLHPRKKALRGFNQCDYLAKGMAEQMEKSWSAALLSRRRNNPSQTKLTREERLKNSEKLFRVEDAGRINGKNILLIDDIVTTGATLESCGSEIIEAGAQSLSIATLGCGEL